MAKGMPISMLLLISAGTYLLEDCSQPLLWHNLPRLPQQQMLSLLGPLAGGCEPVMQASCFWYHDANAGIVLQHLLDLHSSCVKLDSMDLNPLHEPRVLQAQESHTQDTKMVPTVLAAADGSSTSLLEALAADLLNVCRLGIQVTSQAGVLLP